MLAWNDTDKKPRHRWRGFSFYGYFQVQGIGTAVTRLAGRSTTHNVLPCGSSAQGPSRPVLIVYRVATSSFTVTALTVPLPLSARYITPPCARMPSGDLSTRGVWTCTGLPGLAEVASGMR